MKHGTVTWLWERHSDGWPAWPAWLTLRGLFSNGLWGQTWDWGHSCPVCLSATPAETAYCDDCGARVGVANATLVVAPITPPSRRTRPLRTRIRTAAQTDVGCVRAHNEDAVAVITYEQALVGGAQACTVCVVSDGMGGAAAGEIASQLTVHTITRHVLQTVLDTPHWTMDERAACLREAVLAANDAIVAYGQTHAEAHGLGATVVAAIIQEDVVTVAWVGDSRAYLWEPGAFRQITTDHSLVATMVANGQLTADEARTYQHRNLLLRALGSVSSLEVDTCQLSFSSGMRLLLCSDGITTHIEDRQLAELLRRHDDPEPFVWECITTANDNGGTDNSTVVAVFHDV